MHNNMLWLPQNVTAVWCLQSYEGNLAVNLTELGPQIPSDTHLYWYTAETGVSAVQKL